MFGRQSESIVRRNRDNFHDVAFVMTGHDGSDAALFACRRHDEIARLYGFNVNPSVTEANLLTCGQATFNVMHETSFFGDDEGAFKLTDVFGVDAEVGLQRHLHMNACWHIDKRTARPDRCVEGSELVVCRRDDGAKVFLHKVGILPNRCVHVHEYDA